MKSVSEELSFDRYVQNLDRTVYASVGYDLYYHLFVVTPEAPSRLISSVLSRLWDENESITGH